MPNLLHIKGSRTRILNSFPSNTIGNDGDMVTSHIQGKGIYLCTKVNGRWYTNNKLQEINKTDYLSIRELSTNRLKINNITKSSDTPNKFIIGDRNELKYRTSDEILDDLNIPVKSVEYKKAYCSLGQYTNKSDCEAGGGSWYYSDNNSHDSISSTAENQLLTTSSKIGNFDSEPKLLYDGSTLEIKYNADFDDNWQTSATTDLLKLTYDSDSYSTIGVNSNGNLSVTNAGDEDRIQFYFQDNQYAAVQFWGTSSYSYLYMYEDAGTGLDAFYIRVAATGDTLLTTANVSGVGGADLEIQADGNLTLDCDAQVAKTGKIYFQESGQTFGYIASGISPNQTIFRLYEAYGASSDDYFNISCIAAGATTISTVDANAAAADLTLDIDGDITLDAHGKQVNFAFNGTTYAYIDMNTNNFRILNTTNVNDYFNINVDTEGATTISTVDADTTVGHLTLDPDGDLLLQPATHTYSARPIGFTQYDADGDFDATDTIILFSTKGNKVKITLTDNCTDIHFRFPDVSGNFVCVLLQDGTGGRTISNWKSNNLGGAERTLLWAGGTAPTNTETADKADIASFYWDADNQIAYGTYTYNF